MDPQALETLKELYEDNGIRTILDALADFEEAASEMPCEASPAECLSMARQLRAVHA